DLVEPPAAEAGPTKPAKDVRIASHHAPDQLAAVVLDHRQNRPFVDAEEIGVEPAFARKDATEGHGHGGGKAGVERIEKAVAAEETLAVALAHRDERRDRDLGSKGDRSPYRGGGQGPVVTHLD